VAGEGAQRSLRKAIAALEQLSDDARESTLADFAEAMDDGHRHMVDAKEVAALEQGGVAIGLHGKTHTPMTRATNLDAELAGARKDVARILIHPTRRKPCRFRTDATRQPLPNVHAKRLRTGIHQRPRALNPVNRPAPDGCSVAWASSNPASSIATENFPRRPARLAAVPQTLAHAGVLIDDAGGCCNRLHLLV
jgi:hypothetical protein